MSHLFWEEHLADLEPELRRRVIAELIDRDGHSYESVIKDLAIQLVETKAELAAIKPTDEQAANIVALAQEDPKKIVGLIASLRFRIYQLEKAFKGW